MLFWNVKDLARKLRQYQDHYNKTRAHSSLSKKIPNQKAAKDDIPNKNAILEELSMEIILSWAIQFANWCSNFVIRTEQGNSKPGADNGTAKLNSTITTTTFASC